MTPTVLHQLSRLIDEGNGFNDIRFKGAFSNWAVVQGHDDGLNGDSIANDGIWTLVIDSVAGPNNYEWGAIDTDNGNGTTCNACDGSDGQIWFEYSPDVVLQREVIAQQVFDALSFWNSLQVMTFLPPSLVRIGYAPNPIFDLQPLGLTKGGKV